ncbi:MAG: family 16 glycosylhydrolase [Victivallales bacterium]|nr:family 16 glycosylhydrolase [Victivallales bacterium]
MKTHRILVFLWLLAMPLLAEELSFNGDLDQLNEKGFPSHWVLHQWSGYKPFGTIRLLPQADHGRNVIRMENVLAAKGCGVQNTVKLPGRCGDLVRLSFRARGKGNAYIELGMFTADGTWVSACRNRYNFPLYERWSDYIGSIRLTNGYRIGETGLFNIQIVVEQGGELEFSHVTARRDESPYRGSVPFPTSWKAYRVLDRDFMPSREELLTIPATLHGVEPVPLMLRENVLDLRALFPLAQEECAWAFAQLDSPIECDYTIGAGADWWMRYYLNGELVFDTMENGNKLTPVDFSNYVKTLRLHAGLNTLAVQLLAGRAGAKIKTGGPDAFLNVVKKVRLSKLDWIEMFDMPDITVTGNPVLVQGNPTPGLLTVTGQALFTKEAEINPPIQSVAMPLNTYEYRVVGARIQGFGRDNLSDQSGELAFVMRDGDHRFTVTLTNQRGQDSLDMTIAGDTGGIARHKVPTRLLPAGFIVGGSIEGKYTVVINSLVDMSTHYYSGDAAFFANCRQLQAGMTFKPLDGDSAVLLDNFMLGLASLESPTSRVPFKVELLPEFDPVKAGWKKLFDDEFDGDSVDLSKWYFGGSTVPERAKVHDGLLEIACDWNEEHTKVTSASLYTNDVFGYGYFEARVKFRKEHGWWSAFWLYSSAPSNPFYDGFEIDIYEDYYLRPLVPGGQPRTKLDHNLHFHVGDAAKSWNYNTELPGSIDDFYVIGCKWTPFEISYYLDGKLMRSSARHSPYNSVSFDPFNHSTGITPLHAILSGCVHSLSGGDPKDGNFPESFFVDYVRIYEFPNQDAPRIAYRKDQKPLPFHVKEGAEYTISVDVSPSPNTGSTVKGVYLMDSGYLLEYKDKPPYDFKVLFTKEYFDSTDYVRPGKQGVVPNFRCGLHAFAVFVQDEAGNVAHTDALLTIIAPMDKSRPFEGKPRTVPGRLLMTEFDEGGPMVAYYDTTKGNAFQGKARVLNRTETDVDLSGGILGGTAPFEWLNFTIDVKKTGKYRAVFHYGTPTPDRKPILLYCDDVEVGQFQLPEHPWKNGWKVDQTSEAILDLPAGVHILKMLMLSGAFNASAIDLEPLQ